MHPAPQTNFPRSAFQIALRLGLLQYRKLRRAAQPQNHSRCKLRKALRAKLRAREAAGRNAQSSRTTISFKLEQRAAKSVGVRPHPPRPRPCPRSGSAHLRETGGACLVAALKVQYNNALLLVIRNHEHGLQNYSRDPLGALSEVARARAVRARR